VIEIVPFSKAYDRSAFQCGKPLLDIWLREQASQQEGTGNTRTFLAVADSRLVIGYYATTTYRLDVDEAARAFGVGKHRYPVPAVLLARLAVDKLTFYAKAGFTQFVDHPLDLFMTIKDLRATISS